MSPVPRGDGQAPHWRETACSLGRVPAPPRRAGAGAGALRHTCMHKRSLYTVAKNIRLSNNVLDLELLKAP